MSTGNVWITEYSQPASIGKRGIHNSEVWPTQAIVAYNTISLTASTGGALSTQLNAATTFVKITSDTDAWLAFGATNALTAAVTNDYIPAGIPLGMAVMPGSYIAGIT